MSEYGVTSGTVLASNLEYTRTVLGTVIDHPALDVTSISSDGDRALFIVDVDIGFS